jgi:peptidoglycan/LPS O-acetylase OafA/YrhL
MTSSGITAPNQARGAEAAVASAPRHDGLTRLRFVLIGWVVLYHLDLALRVTGAAPWLRPVLGVGYLGVDGFFLLSGFALMVAGFAANLAAGWLAWRLVEVPAHRWILRWAEPRRARGADRGPARPSPSSPAAR